MAGWLIFSSSGRAAQLLADRLTLARLKEVWGDQWTADKAVWPDGITFQAVKVVAHKNTVQEAVFAGVESWHLLKNAEKKDVKTKKQLDVDGWFPEPLEDQ